MRWQRHAGLSPSDWQRVFAFSSAFLPQCPLSLDDITLPQRRAAVRRFKPRAARGPDGFARQDLVGMTDSQVLELLDFLRSVELGRAWPRQWLTGLVLSLDKQNGRTDVQAYRPIVLFSIIYRAWSGLRSRQLLAHLSMVMQCAAYGFLPGRETTEFWAGLQAEIELAVQSGGELCGLSTDLVKAFNGLPRCPLFHMASVIGLPVRVCEPWQRFLDLVERRFMVRQCVSGPITSTVGFPEGCPLSPVAMAITDLAWHCYLAAFEPRVRSHSYVDNLSLTAGHVGHLAKGWTCTQVFCDMLDLELDQAKTYAWALTSEMRYALRLLGMPVKLLANDLGGHMSYGSRIRVTDLQQRCNTLQPVWKALSRVSGPTQFRISLLPAKCWPQALHGMLGCPGGSAELHKLRATAAKTLKLHPAGSSSQLRLSLSGVPTELYVVQRSLLDFRRLCFKQPQLVDQWQIFHARFQGCLHQGPFSRLIVTFETLGWCLLQPPRFLDADGLCFDLLAMASGLLVRLIHRDWLRHVASLHRHRTVTGTPCVTSGALSLHWPCLTGASLSALDNSRLAAIQSGAFLCPASQAKFDAGKTGLRKCCQVPDTVEHRLRFCPAFAEARVPSQWALDLFDVLPLCLTHHLLVPTCPVLQQLRATLHALPGAPVFTRVTVQGDQVQHLFTDGSCFFADKPDLALASWSVVHANSGEVLAVGHLTGIQQTVPRAELQALIHALCWVAQADVHAVIWSDAKHVVDGLQVLAMGGLWDEHQENQDLWLQAWEALQCLEPAQALVKHVPAHIDTRQCEDGFEEWLASFNGRADTAAVLANRNRPWSFMELHEKAMRRFDFQTAVLRAYRDVFFAIAQDTAEQPGPSTAEDEPSAHTG